MKTRNKRLVFLTLVAATLLPLTATAAEWKPNSTMTAIVASRPGGGYDVLMRAMSRLWEKYFGVRVIVQNVAGAGGTLGYDRVATSKPNGQTIGFSSRGPYLAEQLKQHFPWKIQDIPVIVSAKTPPYVVTTGAKSAYKTWDDLRKAKKPVKIAVSSQIAHEMVMIKDLSDHGLEIRTASMNSTGAVTALQVGDLDLWATVASAVLMEPYKAGFVRPLVTLDTERYEDLPDVPMLTEVGIPPKWKAVASYRMWFTAVGTPPEIIDGLATRLKALLSDPEIKDWAYTSGFVQGFVSGQDTKDQQEELLKLLKDNWSLYTQYGGG